MGRGDKKSKKGKRTKGSFGVYRNRNAIKAKLKRTASNKSAEVSAAETEAKPAKKTSARKKAEA